LEAKIPRSKVMEAGEGEQKRSSRAMAADLRTLERPVQREDVITSRQDLSLSPT
jgi:hypothetical protein